MRALKNNELSNTSGGFVFVKCVPDRSYDYTNYYCRVISNNQLVGNFYSQTDVSTYRGAFGF